MILRPLQIIGLALLLAPATARGADPTYKTDVLPFLKAHCFACHGDGKKKAGLSFDKYTDDAGVLADRKTWDAVRQMLTAREMPPPDRPKPKPAEVEAVAKAIQSLFDRHDATAPPNPGRVTIRRLNRVEYNNTIRDLVGLDFKPADDFPADDVGYGFDNIGDVLSVSPLLLEKYLAAAEQILDRAIVIADPPVVTKHVYDTIRTNTTRTTTEIGKVVSFDAGTYKVRWKLVGDGVRATVRVMGRDVKEVEVTGPTTIEERVTLKPGTGRVSVVLVNPDGKRTLHLKGIEIEGPFDAPPVAYPEAYRRLMAHRPGLAPREAAREIVGRFATKAFRRPVKPEEVEQTGPVLSVALSPDGSRVLTGSSDGSARVWDARTGALVHALKGHPKEVMAVAYSPDGKTLATASADTTAVLWSAETGKQTTVLRGHREGVSCVAFSPDGKRIGTGSWENFGIVWDAATGKKIATTARHGNDVLSVTFTADGRRFLTGDREEVVQMWDAATGANVRTFPGHSADIVAFAVRPNGRVLLTGSRDGTVKLWDLATGRDLVTLMTDASRKTWAVVAPDGLLDASEAGRHAMGYRFTKLPGAELDQFFDRGYHPGLLAEVCRGERLFARQPIATTRPPLLKIVAPKDRLATSQLATVEVEVTDQGGGVSGLAVEVNGARMSSSVKPGRRVALPVELAPGKNSVRVRAASADGSWEAVPVGIDLTYLPVPAAKGRLYVVAVGAGERARPLADLFQRRGGRLYDRVDIIPVYDRDATTAAVRDTVADVAELTRPQDTLVVILCGPGRLVEQRLDFATCDGRVGLDDLAAALGTAAAQKRALIVDAAGDPARSAFALRGAVERLARSQGIHTIASLGEPTMLGPALLAEAGTVDVADWFRAAADRAGPAVQCSTRARGFPVLSADR